MLNPTLTDLVGGIQTVTLSDEEARRRGTQKSVLERKAPATFQVLVEILAYQRVAIYHDVAQTVDAVLLGMPVSPEIRSRGEGGEIQKTAQPPSAPRPRPSSAAARRACPSDRPASARSSRSIHSASRGRASKRPRAGWACRSRWCVSPKTRTSS